MGLSNYMENTNGEDSKGSRCFRVNLSIFWESFSPRLAAFTPSFQVLGTKRQKRIFASPTISHAKARKNS